MATIINSIYEDCHNLPYGAATRSEKKCFENFHGKKIIENVKGFAIKIYLRKIIRKTFLNSLKLVCKTEPNSGV